MSSNTDDRIIVNVARGSLIQFKDNETRDNFLFNLQHLVEKAYLKQIKHLIVDYYQLVLLDQIMKN